MGTGSIIQNMDDYIIPLTRFNKGEGGKILDEVRESGVKAIFKKNKREAIIMSPERYDALMEMLYDYQLEQLALSRIKEDDGKSVSFKDVMKNAGIQEKDLEGWEDVELE